MKKRIINYFTNLLVRFLALFSIYPKRKGQSTEKTAARNMFLPVVIGHADTRRLWERIYKEYYDVDVDFSSISVPFLFSTEPHDLVFVHEISLAKAYKNFSKKRGFHDFYSFKKLYRSNDTKLDSWYKEDVVHVRSPKNGTYAIWIKTSFIKAGDSFSTAEDIENEKRKTRNHVTLLEHFLHITYLLETSEYMPTPWYVATLCLGTKMRDGYYPEVKFNALRFGATLSIEPIEYYNLYKVFKKPEWYKSQTKNLEKDPHYATLFSKVN